MWSSTLGEDDRNRSAYRSVIIGIPNTSDLTLRRIIKQTGNILAAAKERAAMHCGAVPNFGCEGWMVGEVEASGHIHCRNASRDGRRGN